MANYSALFRGYFGLKLQKNVSKFIDQNADFENDNENINLYKIVSQKQIFRHLDINYYLLKKEGIDIINCFQPLLNLRNDHMLTKEEMNL
tara:strand:- start:513 stop:782 length:270 start_codon:yes stop_codon:yes gene_type:complete